MKQLITRSLFRYLANNRYSPFTRVLLRISNFVRRAYFNSSNHDIRTNGEALVFQKSHAAIQASAENAPFVVFDVGANEGHWSEIALELCPGCELHVFEVVPATRDILKSNLSQHKDVRVNECGLSNVKQDIEIKYYPDQNTGSSEFDFPWNTKHEMIQAHCDQGDRYMEENGVERINFLKIDVEGADYKVLQGFEAALREGRIDVIQFEYNKAAVLSKRMLRDFYELLGGYSYQIGRLLPNGPDFGDYNLQVDENLLQSNFIAIRNDLRTTYEKA